VLELCKANRILLSGDERDCTVTYNNTPPESDEREDAHGTE